MTLHEQYKEDTKPHPFLKNKGHVKILMKKAYLNSIDCMIAREQNLNPTFGGSLDRKSAMFASNKRGEYNLIWLSEQRDLIANEL